MQRKHDRQTPRWSNGGASLRLACSLGFLALMSAPANADSALERRNAASAEPLAQVETRFGELRTQQNYRLRTIITRPMASRRRLPAVYFVQWLSCDTVEIGQNNDGWTQMLRSLVAESGMVVARLEKAGVGDSEGGPCDTLDYETELAHHRLALQSLFRNNWVDSERVFVFGVSMGANFAPLVAQTQQLRGVVIWGGGAQSWFERQIGFERRALEWGGASGAEIDARMRALAPIYAALLLDRRSLAEVAVSDPQLAGAWTFATGADGESQFGRSMAFHQQAQAQNWAAAWERVDTPVLALFGEYDWYEDRAGVELVGDVVNRRHPGNAEVRILPGLDHNFGRYTSRMDAFARREGHVDAGAVMEIALPWLRHHAR